MQNEPNLKIDPMNVTEVLTTDYGSWTLGIHGKNEPNTWNIPRIGEPKRTQTTPILCKTKPIYSVKTQ